MWLVPSHKLGAQNKRERQLNDSVPSLHFLSTENWKRPPHHILMASWDSLPKHSDYGLNCLKTWAKMSPSSLKLFLTGVFITLGRLTNTVICTQQNESIGIINAAVPLIACHFKLTATLTLWPSALRLPLAPSLVQSPFCALLLWVQLALIPCTIEDVWCLVFMGLAYLT